MIKAVIFDFDGVIADTESERFADVKALLRPHGYKLDDNAFPRFIGKKTGHFLRQEFPEMPEEAIQNVVSERRKREHQYRIIKGLPELLQFLKARGIQTAITTGSDRNLVGKTLDMHQLHFDILITGDMFHTSKPNPECYIITLDKIRKTPDEAIIIEDSIAGIAAGKSAGCTVIALQTYLPETSLAQADYICKDHRDVKALLAAKLQ